MAHYVYENYSYCETYLGEQHLLRYRYIIEQDNSSFSHLKKVFTASGSNENICIQIQNQ
jgi:hypothetical protein